MAEIQSVWAQEILDSRGNPTLAVEVTASTGEVGRAADVPHGRSSESALGEELLGDVEDAIASERPAFSVC